MQITDETLTIQGKNRFTSKEILEVSSNRYGVHETPSINLAVTSNDYSGMASFGTDNIEDIKAIIRHMAKMSGLTVTIAGETDLPKQDEFEVGDRVEVRAGADLAGSTGAVAEVQATGRARISVQLDEYPAEEGWATARYAPEELTKETV